jgi:hypothetical protein
MDAFEGADALAIVTEWSQFRSPDFARFAALLLRTPVVFDGRNLFDPGQVTAAGLTYVSIGRPIPAQPDAGRPTSLSKPRVPGFFSRKRAERRSPGFVARKP